MFQALSRRALAAASFSLTLASATPAAAINLFSVEQDAQVGRQAAQEAERQMPMLRDGMSESYVNAIVQRLARVAPGPRFEYRARVVNTSDINAFALPGGYVYVNRGPNVSGRPCPLRVAYAREASPLQPASQILSP